MSAPAVAADGKGDLAFAWKDMRAGEPNVFARIVNSTAAGEEFRLHSTPAGEQNHPAIAWDRNIGFVAAWSDARSTPQRIYGRRLREGAEFALSAVEEGQAAFPSVAARSGTVVVAYEVTSNSRTDVRLRAIDPGKS